MLGERKVLREDKGGDRASMALLELDDAGGSCRRRYRVPHQPAVGMRISFGRPERAPVDVAVLGNQCSVDRVAFEPRLGSLSKGLDPLVELLPLGRAELCGRVLIDLVEQSV